MRERDRKWLFVAASAIKATVIHAEQWATNIQSRREFAQRRAVIGYRAPLSAPRQPPAARQLWGPSQNGSAEIHIIGASLNGLRLAFSGRWALYYIE